MGGRVTVAQGSANSWQACHDSAMTPAEYLRQLAGDITAITDTLAVASSEPGMADHPVPACPGWTVRDLVRHLGEVERWVVHAITQGNPQAPQPDWPSDDSLGEWYAAGAADLVRHLDQDPKTPAWTFGDARTVGWWQRRQAHEHAIHAWDLRSSLGHAPAIDTYLAHDGIDEVATMFYPRQLRLGRLVEPMSRIVVTTTDTGGRWEFGAGKEVAQLSGPAAYVLLALWHRIPGDHPRLEWSGDAAAGHDILAQPLVP